MQSDFWLMKPFNTLFFLSFAFFLLLLTIASITLHTKSNETKDIVLITACVITLIGFIFYKFFLSRDSDYSSITANMGGFNWWGELPLQLCNINMLMIPIAVWRKSRPLACFCFFLGPLGALMALIMPGNGFDGYPIFLPRMLGYYGTHFMIVIEGLALVTFGMFRPKLRDLPRAILASLLISFAVFCFNLLLRRTGLHPNANYFFAVETEGNPLLELFYSWIPVPFLYLMPCSIILVVYMLAITIPLEMLEQQKLKANR